MVDDSTLVSLIEAADGALRRAITTLQSAYRMVGKDELITEQSVVEAACLLPDSVVEKFDDVTADKTKRFDVVRNAVDGIVQDGYSGSQLLCQYSARLLSSRETGVGAMQDLQKAAVAIALAETEARLVDGADELLQLNHLASRISGIARNPNGVDYLRTC